MALANLNVVDHFLDVLLSHNLETSNDQLEFEMRDFLLGLNNALVDNLKLLHETHWLPVIIKEEARNVPQFNYEHVLPSARVDSGLEKDAEKLVVFSEFRHSGKLMLERLPNVVRPKTLHFFLD